MDHPTWTTERTVSTFLDFYRERGHRRVTGTSLLPPPDDPVLFTTSGMHPLTPYLLGRPHPQGRRLSNVQRCLRTTDLDEVGDPSHLTVFEMLGTWSLGDYDGEQSVRWGHDLLVDGYGLDPRRLHVTVFGGDGQTGPDERTEWVWQELGLPVERTGSQNWWSNGPTGPCGPDTEIFGWTGECPPTGTPTTDERWVEIWNHVTMQHRRQPDGSLTPLPQTGIDTGMGLERLLTFLQGRPSVYETDLLRPWTEGLPWSLTEPSSRLVVDHLRSSVVVLGDDVRPSGTGRGYVLRRLVRRVLTTLWRDDPGSTLVDLPGSLVTGTLDHFGQDRPPTQVRDELLREETRFRTLLQRGRPLVERQLRGGPLSESDFRYLHDTHGLPRELVQSLVEEG